MHRISRRYVLHLGGGAATMLLIGCSGDEEPSGANVSTATTTEGRSVTTEAPDAAVERVPVPESAFEVTGHLVTRWRGDPLAGGSYSYIAKGSRPVDRSTLGEPVNGRLFFAGEAINRDYPATVHGAHNSGVDAAEAILDSGAETVLIVGAGSAGLGAAARLRESGVEPLVIEGRSWVGGRVHTNNSLGVALDLGASWIHGVDGNVLTAIADEAGIERLPSDYDNVLVYDEDGSLLPDDDVPDELVEVLEIVNEYGADLDVLSRDAFIEGEDFQGGDVLFPNGYSEVMEFLAKGTDVLLSTRVTRIHHTGNGVTVEAADDSWNADAVLVTVPLGVLKAGSIEFDPPLPAEKLDAIDRLGMGHLSKVYLRFPEVFWPEDVEIFARLSPELNQFAQWVNYAPVVGEPILMAFHGGRAADALERLEDDEIVAQAVEAVRSMFG